ncbi:G2/M phase-specific E3 ubiquitin-protein ligase-like [Strigops habroptila]|uniref:G2/M phase-specific E3 ubiquitin-protein ligase-like n=1 Tax=Strigops habroptila TaxID=2489341 RepID=UPI0011CEEFB5|nr:G2/M phase-specific E3 ubiquitin-protein ligase-like [Strigops habroptila]
MVTWVPRPYGPPSVRSQPSPVRRGRVTVGDVWPEGAPAHFWDTHGPAVLNVTVATVTLLGQAYKKERRAQWVTCNLRAVSTGREQTQTSVGKSGQSRICAHIFCLFFAYELPREVTDYEGQMRFFSLDIPHTVEHAAQMACSVCGENGATVACWEMGCTRRFHLPCATEGGCVTCYLPPFRSFCWEHRPQQQEEVAPEKTTCLICLDPVEGRTTYGTMVCPACKHAWFHRACIQGQALRSGIFCIQCPLCRNRNWFLVEMFNMGIRIPFRPPSWDDNNAYAELNERHRRCDARECLCPGGRSVAEEEGPWQLFLCCSCAAEGTHRHCSSLGYSHWVRWEVDSCAGPGTCKCQSTQPLVPLRACWSQHHQAQLHQGGLPASVELGFQQPQHQQTAASGRRWGLQQREFNSPRTSSPAASGPSLGPPGEEFNSPSTSSQATRGKLWGL